MNGCISICPPSTCIQRQNAGWRITLGGSIPTEFVALLLWERKPVNNNDTNGLPTCRPLSNIVCLTVMRHVFMWHAHRCVSMVVADGLVPMSSGHLLPPWGHRYVIGHYKWCNVGFQNWNSYMHRCNESSVFEIMACRLFGAKQQSKPTPIARFMGSTWGPSGADRTQVGPMLASWTLLSG